MANPLEDPALDRRLTRLLQRTRSVVERGRVVQAVGTTLRVAGLSARIGQQCRVVDPDGGVDVRAEVVGVADGHLLLAPFAPLHGIALGSEVELLGSDAQLPCGPELLGRVIDAFGQPLDGAALPGGLRQQPLYGEALNPLDRRPIGEPLATGVRAIDALLTVGEGQRVGVFAMAGGGKSTLLGMLARQARADVGVVALIGERGREVREFLDDNLGAHGLARSVVIVSTAERPALERVRAAHAATAIAEGFRARGQRVLLLMDSVTRYARALREIGLAVGEPPVRRGYPPSVFADLPRLFERAGNDTRGSVTAFYTVLVEDEDGSDPVGEEVRSLLDGHIVLSRQLGQAGRYPAIDVLASASRLFPRVATREHQDAARHVRALLARHAEIEFLLRVGEYERGSDPLADEAIAKLPRLEGFLRQRPDEPAALDDAVATLQELAR